MNILFETSCNKQTTLSKDNNSFLAYSQLPVFKMTFTHIHFTTLYVQISMSKFQVHTVDVTPTTRFHSSCLTLPSSDIKIYRHSIASFYFLQEICYLFSCMCLRHVQGRWVAQVARVARSDGGGRGRTLHRHMVEWQIFVIFCLYSEWQALLLFWGNSYILEEHIYTWVPCRTFIHACKRKKQMFIFTYRVG